MTADSCLAQVALSFGTEVARDFILRQAGQKRTQSTSALAVKAAQQLPVPVNDGEPHLGTDFIDEVLMDRLGTQQDPNGE